MILERVVQAASGVRPVTRIKLLNIRAHWPEGMENVANSTDWPVEAVAANFLRVILEEKIKKKSR